MASIKEAMTALADAIRKKTGKTEKMKVADMPAEIAGIPAGGHDKEIIEGTITSYKNDEVEKVRDYAFEFLYSLTSVSLPAATLIGIYAFSNCGDLKSADLPAATSIGDSAFQESGLTAIDLPAVTSIDQYGFYHCSNLASVKIGSKNPNVCILSNSNAFSGTPVKKGTGFLYVPDALIDSYKTATNWSVYANQIKPLSEEPTT